jgi:hypothetical protein
MVVHARTLFSTHHIDLPAGNVTPDQVRQAINEWLLKTFEREWKIVASGVDELHVPHGPTDPFEPDEDDPHDPLGWLLPLPSPQFLRGLCAAQGCSYLAYAHPFCAACCKRKFQVEVKRTTRQGQPGLGLFATATLTGRTSHVQDLSQMHAAEGEYIINFSTLAEEIEKKECTAPLQYDSP